MYTRAYYRSTRGRIKYTSQASTTALFSKTKIEVSQVPMSQKQALVNAFIMSAIPPCVSTQTPKRGTAMQKCIHEHSLGSCRVCRNTFAGAKVVYFFDIRKLFCAFLQIVMHFACIHDCQREWLLSAFAERDIESCAAWRGLKGDVSA